MKTPLLHDPSTPLKSGFTTGACAAAAAKGAALMLAHQITVREVTIELPAGISATFRTAHLPCLPDPPSSRNHIQIDDDRSLSETTTPTKP